MLENYEVNSSTLALLALDDHTTKAVEKEKEYYISKPSLKIMDESCKYFGSSYLGREEGSRNLIGSNYKVPIIVEETKRMIFIPTSSPKFSTCDWIAFHHIYKYEEKENGLYILFDNGKQVSINMSYYSFENQMLRASKLENTIRNRIS